MCFLFVRSKVSWWCMVWLNDRYVGEHAFDKADGKGKEYYKDGGRYEGTFKKGEKHGHGIFYYPDDSRYDDNEIRKFNNYRYLRFGLAEETCRLVSNCGTGHVTYQMTVINIYL